MEYFTAADKTVLFGIAAGLFSGLLSGYTQVALIWWNEEAAVSQSELIIRSLSRGAIQAITFGAGAFVLGLYDTETAPQSMRQFLFFLAIVVGIGEPLFERAWDWLIDRDST
ncbi:hypothetical protein S7335_3513 [Synechococcus sp. PCC 7335]|uniref:hypothetical protein n=1 Tax=Synechococcus sp. (strain ATCC 29403 / PCC 7335) TaxID=91464 RepID=UPI00017EDCA7|nr:hypothetical protein [Synechococcus sp. PCC 7335]EDX85810.1 hypothetical protein S7335_3513 [Synechococcus sp. PCC 7335]